MGGGMQSAKEVTQKGISSYGISFETVFWLIISQQ
jgi:hypothetical protein